MDLAQQRVVRAEMGMWVMGVLLRARWARRWWGPWPFGSTAAHEPRDEQRGEPPRRGGTNENQSQWNKNMEW